MSKRDFCKIIHQELHEIREEYNLSQMAFASMMGVSKKTYIQLEKKRIVLKWSEAVTVASIFNDSIAIKRHYGDDVISIIQLHTFDQSIVSMNGYQSNDAHDIVMNSDDYSLIRIKVSNLFKIIDNFDKSLYASFSERDIIEKFNEIIKQKEKQDE